MATTKTKNADELKGRQSRLSEIKARIERELKILDDEVPQSKRAATEAAFKRALERASGVGKAAALARQALDDHRALFTVTMRPEDIPVWVEANRKLEAEAAAYGDLWRLSEIFAERCRQRAEDARTEPDPQRQRLLHRVNTLKSEYESMRWQAQAGQRGQEILAELQELGRLLNPPLF